MEKYYFRKKFLNFFINNRIKLQKNYYPEIESIFGEDNNALQFETCAISQIRLKHELFLYKIYTKDVEDAYHYILQQLTQLIKDIKPNPKLYDILYIYSYILYSGYLSINNNFKFTIPDHEVEIRKGLSIFDGQGVCRNVASLLSDLLSYFDIKSFGIITYRTDDNSKLGDLIEPLYNLCIKDYPEFNKEWKEHLESHNVDSKKLQTGNHFEVVAYDNGWYILDPSTVCMSKITSNKTDYPILNNLRFWYLYAGGESLKFTTNMYNFFKDKSISICKCNHIIDIQKDCFNRCEKNKVKILKFRQQVNDDINYIHESLQTLPD